MYKDMFGVADTNNVVTEVKDSDYVELDNILNSYFASPIKIIKR